MSSASTPEAVVTATIKAMVTAANSVSTIYHCTIGSLVLCNDFNDCNHCNKCNYRNECNDYINCNDCGDCTDCDDCVDCN